MPTVEYKGLIRVTVGSISRSDQLDLWRIYEHSEWYQREGELQDTDGLRRLMETDAMVAAIATRKIEICKAGKWVVVKDEANVDDNGERLHLSFPPEYAMINQYPRELGDRWIQASVELNGSIFAHLHFFSSLILENGKTNSAPESDVQP